MTAKEDIDLKHAVYKTLVYSGVFNYPLKINEVSYWLHSLDGQELAKKLHEILSSNRLINSYQGYYALKSFSNGSSLKQLVNQRQQKEIWSQEKLMIAKRVSKWLKIIPTIEMVAITGTLAVNQAHKDDDIDLMIVTAPGTLWTTRCGYLLILQLLKVRRKPLNKVKQVNKLFMIKNKICPNLLMDRDYLCLPRQKHNLYYAHEIIQAKLLWDRHHTFDKFINDNDWIANLLPHAWEDKQRGLDKIGEGWQLDWPDLIIKLVRVTMRLIEPLMRSWQSWYMSSKRTIETVTPYTAQFYPVNYQDKVMTAYKKRLQQLGIK